MGVLITEILAKIFSKYSQRDKRFVNNFSENEYIKTPIGEKLKQSMLITMKHSEGSYVAPLIYSVTWHFAKQAIRVYKTRGPLRPWKLESLGNRRY